MTEPIIENHILQHGFISLDEYMRICLYHNTYGYYRTGNPIGQTGDFITAPEISQIFGELIGVFISFHLDKLFPNGYQICELGAGRGTLANDYLRILQNNPPHDIFFLETNVMFQKQQSIQIPYAKHIKNLNQLPLKPTLFLANEFFDALPIKAFKLFGAEQAEIIITLDNHTKKLKFDTAKATKNQTNRYNGYYETSLMTLDFCKHISNFIKNHHSSFLCCDYGYMSPPNKMTFRGFMNHAVTDGLQKPFHEDLTADVNFTEIIDYFYKQDVTVFDLLTQREFFNALHIETRLHKLLRNIEKSDIKQQMINGIQKLINPTEMGERFKFLFITHTDSEFYPFVKRTADKNNNNRDTHNANT